MTPAQFNKNVFHPLQTYEWGQYCQKLGFKVVRHIIKENRGAASGIQVLIQKSAVQNCNLAYVPRAELPGQKQFSCLREIGRKHSCLSLKIEPRYGWRYPMTRANQIERRRIEKVIRSQKGVKSRSVYPRFTLLIPLEMPDEILLQNMHQKTRYNIRLAERKGVKVTLDTSTQCFEEFLRLFFQVTVVRMGIAYPHSPKTLRLFWETMKPTGMLHMLKATHRGETLAVMMLLRVGDQLYFPHGASSRAYKNVMANYGLMWRAMQFGKEIGCSVLDLWGIYGPASEGSLPSKGSGLFRFYNGFGAKIFEWIGAYDLIL